MSSIINNININIVKLDEKYSLKFYVEFDRKIHEHVENFLRSTSNLFSKLPIRIKYGENYLEIIYEGKLLEDVSEVLALTFLTLAGYNVSSYDLHYLKYLKQVEARLFEIIETYLERKNVC